MKKRFFINFVNIFFAAMIVAACGPGPDTEFTEYYVSVTGSDTTGDGSMARPWRHIQYALNNIDYTSDPPPRLNLLKGIYREEIRVTRSITIKGAGEWGPAAVLPGSPDIPTTEVSMIVRNSGITATGHVIEGSGVVANFSDLVFMWGRVNVRGAAARFDHVQFLDVMNRHGLQIHNSPLFAIRDSEFRTPLRVYSDIAVDLENSIGVIERTYMGDWFDHVIDIGLDNNVVIDEVEIHGSPIWYADGIRIRGGNHVTIQNSTIIRNHADNEAASSGALHNPAYAGIQVSGWSTGGNYKITITDNIISGFDVGIEVAPVGFRLMASGNTISGVSHPARSFYYPYSGVGDTIVDFGGGPLGSVGNNTFTPPGFGFSFFHNAPYDVFACFNNWVVPDSQVDPSRIWDRLDDGSLGRVRWNVCAREPITIEETPELFEILTFTPAPQQPTTNTDTLCWEGPGPAYNVVSSVQADTQVTLLGVGEIPGWFVIDNPRFPGVDCWIDEDDVDIDPTYDRGSLATFDVPPLPTPTFTPAPTATFTPIPVAPAAPSGLAANTTGCNDGYQVTISWKDNANNEQGFRVYRKGPALNDQFVLIFTTGPNVTQRVDTPPDSGPYTYYVEAFNAAGTSQQSNAASDSGCLI